MAFSLVFADTFNRADGALGANWQNTYGAAATVVSNMARFPAANAASCALVAVAGANPPDGAVEFRSGGVGAYGAGLFRSAGQSSKYGYNGYILFFGATGGLNLSRVTAGGLTSLGTYATNVSATLIRAEFVGSSIKVYSGCTAGDFATGTLRISATDAAYTAGFCGITTPTSNVCIADDFAIYAYATGGMFPMLLCQQGG